MCLCISALSYQVSYICFNSYHYINHWFIGLLYIFCMMNVVRMWQMNIVLRNISGVTEVHWYGGLYVPHKIFSLFYEREELRKYFSMITHAICLFSMITDANCLFSMITHAICPFSVIAHPICLFSIITHAICLFSVIAHPICLFSMIRHAICLFSLIAHAICLFSMITHVICLFFRDSTR